MKKINVEICTGNCSHLQQSNSILTFIHSLSAYTKNRLNLEYNSCKDCCGKGPRVKVGNKLIYKASPRKIVQAFVKQKIPVRVKGIEHY